MFVINFLLLPLNILSIAPDPGLKTRVNEISFHEVVHHGNVLFISVGVLVDVLDNAADRVHGEGKNATGYIHCNVGSENFNWIGTGKISVADSNHGHGGPIKTVIILTPNAFFLQLILNKPGHRAFWVIVGGCPPYAGEEMTNNYNGDDQLEQIKNVEICPVNVQKPIYKTITPRFGSLSSTFSCTSIQQR